MVGGALPPPGPGPGFCGALVALLSSPPPHAATSNAIAIRQPAFVTCKFIRNVSSVGLYVPGSIKFRTGGRKFQTHHTPAFARGHAMWRCTAPPVSVRGQVPQAPHH